MSSLHETELDVLHMQLWREPCMCSDRMHVHHTQGRLVSHMTSGPRVRVERTTPCSASRSMHESVWRSKKHPHTANLDE